MSQTLIAICLLVATVLVVGLLSHLLLLAAVGTAGFMVGRAYASGRLALGRKRSHGSLGR